MWEREKKSFSHIFIAIRRRKKMKELAQKSKTKTYEIDMCNGPLLGKILRFYFPLMLSGVLQLLFNAADIVVVGQFAGSDAMAAVGSTSALINLIVNLFMGLSVGANVLTAGYYGAKQKKDLQEVVQTSILTSIICGIFLAFLGCFVAKPALIAMGNPPDVLKGAALYMCIYFMGMPIMMLYNFGSAILRAVGDTKRPLYFLVIAGIINVVLNCFFVIVFSLGVAGVALATVISQGISAILILRCLITDEADYRVNLKELKISSDKLWRMIRIGVPAGLQGTLFAISNVLIQSSINSFGKIAMAGNTAAANIEGFVWITMNSMYQTSISFTSQNYGARQKQRIKKIAFLCIGLVIVIGFVFGNLAQIFSPQLLHIYSSDPVVISYGVHRLKIICTTYFLCGMMDVAVGSIRGMNYSLLPTIVSLTGVCVFRVIWIYGVFAQVHTLECLYYSYPISWTMTFVAHLICFIIIYHLFRVDDKTV